MAAAGCAARCPRRGGIPSGGRPPPCPRGGSGGGVTACAGTPAGCHRRVTAVSPPRALALGTQRAQQPRGWHGSCPVPTPPPLPLEPRGAGAAAGHTDGRALAPGPQAPPVPKHPQSPSAASPCCPQPGRDTGSRATATTRTVPPSVLAAGSLLQPGLASSARTVLALAGSGGTLGSPRNGPRSPKKRRLRPRVCTTEQPPPHGAGTPERGSPAPSFPFPPSFRLGTALRPRCPARFPSGLPDTRRPPHGPHAGHRAPALCHPGTPRPFAEPRHAGAEPPRSPCPRLLLAILPLPGGDCIFSHTTIRIILTGAYVPACKHPWVLLPAG
ncbi:translation initiation factor IF-2-like [Cygnus olor]|uniref:translation initiation factor IF-2-like n=1 Tax=Cygnus olor TaxID=8869 RepID=UPI001ADE553D|nr:translation initiation factor IF-2-like [Cygnus olor]